MLPLNLNTNQGQRAELNLELSLEIYVVSALRNNFNTSGAEHNCAKSKISNRLVVSEDFFILSVQDLISLFQMVQFGSG